MEVRIAALAVAMIWDCFAVSKVVSSGILWRAKQNQAVDKFGNRFLEILSRRDLAYIDGSSGFFLSHGSFSRLSHKTTVLSI